MGDSVQSSDVQSGAVSAGSLTIPSGVGVTFAGAVSTGWASTDHLSIYALVAKVEDPAAAIAAGIGVFYVKKARNQKEMNKE